MVQNVAKPIIDELNKTIKIDSLLWSTSFLKTATFRSGKEIPIIEYGDEDKWLQLCKKEKPCMCYWLFNEDEHALYNYYAISSKENIAPLGFRLPTIEEGSEGFYKIVPKLQLPDGIMNSGGYFESKSEFKSWVIDSENYNFQIEAKGYWGFPVLLIKENDTGTINNDNDSAEKESDLYFDSENNNFQSETNDFWTFPQLLIKENGNGGINNDNDSAENDSDIYNVILEDEGASKLALIKVIKGLTGLGLKEAKDLVEEAPSCIKEGLNKAEVEAIKIAIEEAGGVVMISNSKKITT